MRARNSRRLNEAVWLYWWNERHGCADLETRPVWRTHRVHRLNTRRFTGRGRRFSFAGRGVCPAGILPKPVGFPIGVAFRLMGTGWSCPFHGRLTFFLLTLKTSGCSGCPAAQRCVSFSKMAPYKRKNRLNSAGFPLHKRRWRMFHKRNIYERNKRREERNRLLSAENQASASPKALQAASAASSGASQQMTLSHTKTAPSFWQVSSQARIHSPSPQP